jgi:hypothetical protein
MSEYKKLPTNTTEEAKANPVIRKLGPLAANKMGAVNIPAQEKRGQQELVNSHVLPSDMHTPVADFLALGFTFGEYVPGDPIFRVATLPHGWRREASEHDMWSYLVDERGVQRVAVFYKAAYYDRNAHMRLINVGRELASRAVWGDDIPTAGSLNLDRLTADERAAFAKEIVRIRADLSPTARRAIVLNIEAIERILATRED